MNIPQIQADLAAGIMVSRVTIKELADVARLMQTTLQEIQGAAEPDEWSAMMAKNALAAVERK